MLRPATQADFPFCHAVASTPTYARFVEDEPDAALTHYVTDPDFALLIWEHEGAPCGFALFCGLTNPANRAELRRLALKTAGGGRGTAFLTELRDYAFTQLGVNCLWLDVAVDNPRARHLYEKVGFQYEGTLRARWKRPAGDITDLDLLSILRPEWDALPQ